MSARQTLERRGVRIVELDGLSRPAVYVRAVKVLLVADATDGELLVRAVEVVTADPASAPPADSDDTMALLLDALGVTVVEVPGLKDNVCYVRSQRVGLIREGMTDTQRVAALEWLFGDACRPEDEA